MAGEWTVDATSSMDGAEALLEAFASGGAGEIQVDPAGDGFKASASAPSAAVAAKLAAKAISLGATAKMRRS